MNKELAIECIKTQRQFVDDMTCEAFDMAIDLIKENIAPVRHGHWIKISPAGIYECSECGKNVMTSDIEAYEYCHGCGARMDGEYKNCGTCKHHDKWWDEIICDGCTKAHSNWERKDDE